MTVHVGSQIAGSPEDFTKLAKSTIGVLSNNKVIFRCHGGVAITCLKSYCVTDNDATASTVQYKIIPTVGSSTTISGTSASLANATAGTIIVCNGDAFATAPTVYASGVALNTTARGIVFEEGELQINVGVGSTTGTWYHFMRYEPLVEGSYVEGV